ncbi:bifunctional aspartate transaminase/aspartate 4-decarboxylase [Arthrobacter sunyaminii]|uniref:bifunctional aspartate transaminase/aspartate 4-decarboxylase n=1 Tax=Arthrobacter sunyaminii TaxID=2816859 RepID=UPI001A94B4C4|nr:bifunctional aspartate transaminase/aspartate 4-decarboxylase [Arthrobacter sunyaminii]MBO0895443.1 bifunctional aspartate transaminase/aspartate 4-decarboxylase [Arthrobacter sunyaminii]
MDKKPSHQEQSRHQEQDRDQEQDLAALASLSPFELKDRLIAAASGTERLMLNAGRGNPNFLATLPRRAFLALGDFAVSESERSYSYLDSGFGGLPEQKGMLGRFNAFVVHDPQREGLHFLRSAVSYVHDQLGLDREAFLEEMVTAFLGCIYPTPPRVLPQTQEVLRAYLGQELFGGQIPAGAVDVFPTEGGTAAMTYIFSSLAVNGLITPGDRIALATPIFSPYLEIPLLPDYGLDVVQVVMDESADWQLPNTELEKLLDPAIKVFCLVNPSNPPSAKQPQAVLERLARLVADQRPDLIIITDDVYATFADDFVSVFAVCPRNTLCVYSFSKYFGATGWRLGTIALHQENVIDDLLDALPAGEKQRLNARYSSLTTDVPGLKFIDRLVADSRSVALNHTAGISGPQQLQMVLFALHGLMDRLDRYQDAAKALIRGRYNTLYRNMGVAPTPAPDDVGYYSLIDLRKLGSRLYGDEFAAWLVSREDLGLRFLLRLASETGVVLLPGKGFDVVVPSVRVSLANLTDFEYRAIGAATRRILEDYHRSFTEGG